MTAQTAAQRDACLRVIFLAKPPPRSDQVAYADWQTTMADARTALCLACGVPPEYITAAGFDVSDRSYRNVRGSWTRHIEQWGYSDMFDGPHLGSAEACWQVSRPDLMAGDDWLADGVAGHRLSYPEGCDRSSCDICALAEWLADA
jgi:hypothetical protein